MESTFEKALKAKEQRGEVVYLSVEDSRKIDQAISDALGLTVPGTAITSLKKQYEKPCCEVVRIEHAQMLCGSGRSYDPDAMP